MYLVGLELMQQVIYLLCLGDEICRSYQTLPTEIIGFADMWQQVFDISDASYIVNVVFIYRYSAVVVVDDALQDFLEGGVDVYIYDVLSVGHDLTHHLVRESYDTL